MSEALKMTGLVFHVGETEVFDSGLQKRLLIIAVEDGGYTNKHAFQVMKDKVGMFDGLKEGDTVEVDYNESRCREYGGKWYCGPMGVWKLNCTKKAEGGGSSPATATPPDDFDPDMPF